MANRAKQEYKLVAGEKEYIIKFDMNALANLEDELGLTVPEIGVLAQAGKFGIKIVRSLLWGGLLHADENVTLKDAGNILGEVGLEETATTVVNALTDTLQGNKKKDAQGLVKQPKN